MPQISRPLLTGALTAALLLAPLAAVAADPAETAEFALPTISFDALADGRLAQGAIDTDGRLWTWGRNHSGELLRPGAQSPAAPAPATDPLGNGLTRVSFGPDRALGLDDDGTVWTWGEQPIEVDLPEDATAVVTGTEVDYALLADGTVWSWDRDTAPTRVELPGPVAQLVAGDSRAAALGADGSLWAWDADSTPTPVNLGGRTATALAAGDDHLAVLADGQVLTWGANASGQLGLGSTEATDTPTPVDLGEAVPAVLAAGGANTAVIDTAGQVWAWGDNIVGTVGDGSTGVLRVSPTPATGTDGLGLTELSIGALTMYGLDADGQLWGWGLNDAYQLGVATPMTAAEPLLVDLGLTVTDVTFDGGSALSLTQSGRTVTAGVPAHPVGPVEVVITAIDRNDDPVPPRVIAEGYTYRATVTVDSQGGSTVDPVPIADAGVVALPVPEKTGYDFDGWALDAAGTELFDQVAPLSADQTVYAVWAPAGTGTWSEPVAVPQATATDAADPEPNPEPVLTAQVRTGALAGTGVPFGLALLAALVTLGAGTLLLRWLRRVMDPLD